MDQIAQFTNLIGLFLSNCSLSAKDIDKLEQAELRRTLKWLVGFEDTHRVGGAASAGAVRHSASENALVSKYFRPSTATTFAHYRHGCPMHTTYRAYAWPNAH